MEIKFNVKHKFKKIDNLISKLPKALEIGVEDVLKNIQGDAIKIEKGHNEDGIIIEMVESSTLKVKGRVYADPNKFMTEDNISYLGFEYFGTGEFAEKNHIGKTTHFKESGYTQWFIPKNKVKKELPYPTLMINGNEFYIAKGVKPNHFFTDAEFKTRYENLDIIQDKIYKMLEEVCK